LVSGFGVVRFCEAIRPHIPKEDIDIHLGVDLFQLQSVLDRLVREEVLEQLVPRLKIASRCSFSERWLVIRGDLRTYKIHLGSSKDINSSFNCDPFTDWLKINGETCRIVRHVLKP
jgi:hypothetical protein